MKVKDALNMYLNDLDERQLSAAYLQIVSWRLGKFVSEWGDTPLGTVTRADIAHHIRQLESTGRAEATIAGFVQVHKSFWSWCKVKRLTEKNLGKKLRKRSFAPSGVKAAAESDIRRVLSVLKPFVNHRNGRSRDIRDALFVSLSIDSGARLGEMTNLKRSEVERALERGKLTSRGVTVYRVASMGKTGHVHIRFFDETAVLMKRWLALAPKAVDRVFVSLQTGEMLRCGSLSRSFDRVCKYAGIPVFHSHAVRHRNVTVLIRQSGDANHGRGYANHSELSTTLIYYDEILHDDIDESAAEMSRRRRSDSPDEDYKQIARLFGIE